MNVNWQDVYAAGGVSNEQIYKSGLRNLGQDYLEKLCISVMDFQICINKMDSRANVVYVIILMVWIFDSLERFQSTLRKDLLLSFVFSEEVMFQQALKYQKALRSFAVAHPLDTTMHKSYSLDGNFLCLDISPFIQKSATFVAFDCKKDVRHLGLNGMSDVYYEDDCLLTVYSKKDDSASFHRYVGFSSCDIEKAVLLCIEKLKELDVHLSNMVKQEVCCDKYGK